MRRGARTVWEGRPKLNLDERSWQNLLHFHLSKDIVKYGLGAKSLLGSIPVYLGIEKPKDIKFIRRMDLNAMTVSHSNEVVDTSAGNAHSRGNTNRGGPFDLGDNFEHSVKVFRDLERRGHITSEMRTQLLTWYSLRATARDRRVVDAYITTLGNELSSLANQLVDSFPGVFACNKKPRTGV